MIGTGRWFKNSNAFSEGHNRYLPRHCAMFDIDRAAVASTDGVNRMIDGEDKIYVEHRGTNRFVAMFSLKQRTTHHAVNKMIEGCAQDFTHQAMAEFCRKLRARLFVVFHAEHGGMPLEFYEWNDDEKKLIYKLTIDLGIDMQQAWSAAWNELGLL